MSRTVSGLIQAWVLVETHSMRNTPVFPVMKADKSKYRLVHDLRMIKDVVQDWPAEAPNPHILLTNGPPDAKFFMVVDLCSAFFSVP